MDMVIMPAALASMNSMGPPVEGGFGGIKKTRQLAGCRVGGSDSGL